MKRHNIGFYLLICVVLLSVYQRGVAQEGWTMKISVPTNRVEFGAPVILNLDVKFQEPRIWRWTGKPSRVVDLDGLAVRVCHQDTDHESLFPFRLPIDFHLRDTEGLEYQGKAVLFRDLYEEKEKLINEMIFDKPGAYRLTIIRREKEVSNTVHVLVEPSAASRKALGLLTQPEDFAFLIGGLYKSPKTISKLKEVVKKYGGTVLGRMAAARLGIEYFEQFRQKYPSSAKVDGLVAKGLDTEPLFEAAYRYLSTATVLPDRFPIRAEVLSGLSSIEYVRRNYEKAVRLLDELAKKYPQSEEGRKAPRWKKELVELQARKIRQQAPLAEPRSAYTFLLVTLGIVGVTAAILAAHLTKTHAGRSK